MKHIILDAVEKFKRFYCSSAENRTESFVFFGFVILPAIGMIGLFIYACIFWL